MKLLFALLCVSTTYSAPTPQFGFFGGLGSMFGSGMPLAAQRAVKPQLRQGAKRVVLSYGPIEMVGATDRKPMGTSFSMDPDGQAGFGMLSQGMCTKCTVLSGRFVPRYEDGTPAGPDNGLYIHHVLSYDVSKSVINPIGSGITGMFGNFFGGGAFGSGAASGGSLGSLPIAAFLDSGEDSGYTNTMFTSEDGSHNSGFHLDSPSVLVQYDFVNMNETPKKVFLDLEMEYVDGLQGQDSGHKLVSVMGKPKVSPSGPATSYSPKMPVNADTTIVWARGHLHPGGDQMVMSVNDKDVCTSVPKYEGEVISTMSLCPEPIPLKKGDFLTVRSVYDLTKHPLRESHDGSEDEGMGMFAISYALPSTGKTS